MKDQIINLSPLQQVAMDDEWFDLSDSSHFWMQWRFRELLKIVNKINQKPTRILEIGCGTGVVMQQFEEHLQWCIDGCDLNIAALSNTHKVCGNLYQYNIHDLHPDLTGKCDIVLLLDVLEHIEDDGAFLQSAVKHLKPGGFIIINVPALQSLFSRYDERVGHQRRYNTRQLTKLMRSHDLSNVESHYWGFSMLPLAWIRKYYLQMVSDQKIVSSGFKPPSGFVHSMLKIIMKIETSLPWRKPIGTSVLAIGRKPIT